MSTAFGSRIGKLAVTSAMAATDTKLSEASAAFLDVLNAIASGQAQDASDIGSAIDAAAGQRALSLGDGTRDQGVAYFEQLRSFDYGPYSHGLVVQAASDSEIRITPAH